MAASVAAQASSSEARGQPLFDTIAEDGPLTDAAAASVLQSLLDYVERQEAYVPLLPSHVYVSERGAISVSETASPPCVPPACELSGDVIFVPPEAPLREVQSAYTWNLGVFLYVLLTGYPPFASKSVACPFWESFVASSRLSCPAHFTSPVISLLCGMIALPPEARMTVHEARAEVMTWQLQLLRPVNLSGNGNGNGNGKHRKTLKRAKDAGAAALTLCSSLGVAAGREGPRCGGASSGGVGAGPAASTEQAAGVAGAAGAAGEAGEAGGAVERAEAEPATATAAGREGGHAAAAQNGFIAPGPQRLRTGDAPPPPSPVVGPHGVARTSLQSLALHPNSPPFRARSQKGQRGSQRPLAVLYSPDSELPRKVSPDVASLWARADTRAPAAARSCVPVRRLGWEMPAEGGLEGSVERVGKVLSVLGVPFEVPGVATNPLSIKTLPCNFAAMGSAQMQAVIFISEADAAEQAEGRCGHRIDVSRHSGDTFQFHAFYRKLRAGLGADIGWNGVDYVRRSGLSGRGGASGGAGGAGGEVAAGQR